MVNHMRLLESDQTKMGSFWAPPVIGVLPALVDGIFTSLFLCQLPLLVHVRSSHQLDSEAETLLLGQTQIPQQQRPGLLRHTHGERTLV